MSVSVAVFASGGGSNFQSLLDFETPGGTSRINLLISDNSEAGALARAERAGVPTRVIRVKGRPPEEVASETLDALREAEIQVVALAGYLRLIPAEVVRTLPRRILNIHPALLPGFGGKGMWGHHVHEAVLASGASFSGPTIHFADEEYDTGSIFAQWPVPVLAGDTPEALGARVLRVEHILYPLALNHLCSAISRGIKPSRLSPPGQAFQIAPDFESSVVAEQISAAFSSTL